MLILLTGNENPPVENELYNEDIETLASEGGQPTLLQYKARDLIMVWDKVPNERQKKRLAEVLLNAHYQHEQLESTSGQAGSKSPSNTATPLSRSLKKRKIERIYSFYTAPEYSPAIRDLVQRWRQRQNVSIFACSLL